MRNRERRESRHSELGTLNLPIPFRVQSFGFRVSDRKLGTRTLELWDTLLVEKLAREFGRRLADLEDFFFRLILELFVLLRGKTVFSRKDAELF